MIEIVLTGAPMGKERVKRGAAGNAYTPERTVRFESRLALAAQNVMAGRPLLDGPLAIEMTAYMPIPASWSEKKKREARAGGLRPIGKPDADNILKCVDGCNLVVWRDDAQIVSARIEKWYSDRPQTILRVGPAQNGVLG